MRAFLAAGLIVLSAVSAAKAVEDGPVTITGHVASNTLTSGRFFGVAVGEPVTMTFKTLKGGFNPFWGPSGHFCNVDETSFELHIGTGDDEKISYTAANNSSILFTNAGFVTTAVSQCLMEFFQMSLDSPGYSVYFKAQGSVPSVAWTTPLVCGLPAVTPSSAFDIAEAMPTGSCDSTTPTPSRACWWVQQTSTTPMMTTPIMTIDFDGTIMVSPTPCMADYNEDNIVTVQDIFDFLNGWFAGCTGSASCDGHSADFNCSNTIEVQDIFDFLNAWFAGC